MEIFCFAWRQPGQAAKPWEKPLAQSGFIHRACWPLINFIWLHLNQWQWASPTMITWTGMWRHDTFAWHNRSGLVWIHCFCGTNYVILLWKMFPIQSIGCRAVYLMLMLCVVVDTTALCRKFAKESQYFSMSRMTICLLGRVPTDRKIWSDCHWSRKFKLRTLKTLPDGKQQLQMVKIRIQNAVPASLVCCRHCVVQQSMN